MMLSPMAERLLERARQRCGYIEPCAGKSWEESITVERGRAMLWFNSADGNTHIESEEVEGCQDSAATI